MEKERLIRIICDYFQQAGLPLEKVWLFGSYARDEQDKQSDIDLMLRFSKNNKIDLWDFAGIKLDLEDLTGLKVDLVKEGLAKPFASDSVKRDKILIYERKTKRQGTAAPHP